MKKKLKQLLEYESANYKKAFSRRDWIIAALTDDPQYMLWKFQKMLRYSEYYYDKYKKANNKIFKILWIGLFLISKKRRNKLGNRLSIDIRENSCKQGLILYHNNIIINGHARIGENCMLHGSNIIGNDGKTPGTPRIGDNVEVGAGAVIIGDIEIADNIKIGAGAVVTKSFTNKGGTLVGVPAREVKK